TTYSYTVQAFDAAGNRSVASTPATATTPAPADTTPPSTPGGLTGVAVGPNRIDLSWTASTDNVGVTGYTIRRGGTVLANVGSGTTSYSDMPVDYSTTYGYAIDAFDAS